MDPGMAGAAPSVTRRSGGSVLEGSATGASWGSAMIVAICLMAAGPVAVQPQDPAGEPMDAAEYVRRSLGAFPIVCLAEGGHAAREPHRFLQRLLSDTAVLAAVDVIIVEFAAGRHQAVLDAYIRGEDVTFSALSRIWRDTQQSPAGPWDSPLYQELLRVIRDANRLLPSSQQVRVLAGDPPIDWEAIRTRDEFTAARIARDPYVAKLAMEQAFVRDKTVLILFGGAHLPRIPIAPGDPRNSLTHRILLRHPGTVRAIGFLNPENLGIENRIDQFEAGKVYPTDGHWVGGLDAARFFPMVYTPVVDTTTGRQRMQPIRLYTDRKVRELFDALVYVGPSSQWEIVPASLDAERDAAYIQELHRRSMIRFGRPHDTRGDERRREDALGIGG